MDANRKRGAMEKSLDDMLFGGGMPAPRRRKNVADAPTDKPKDSKPSPPKDSKPSPPKDSKPTPPKESKPTPILEPNKPAVNKSSDSVNRSEGGKKSLAK